MYVCDSKNITGLFESPIYPWGPWTSAVQSEHMVIQTLIWVAIMATHVI